MNDTTTIEQTIEPSIETSVTDAPAGQDLLDEELLVEEISIDGMCGVY